MSTKAEINIAPPIIPAKKRKLRRLLILTGLALVVVLVGLGFYLNSNSFRETVRQRVIAELRQMTGAR